MNNEVIISLLKKWYDDVITQEELCDLLSGIVGLLATRDQKSIDNLLQEVPKDQYDKIYNLLGVCSSHQHGFNEDGEFVAGQYQMLLPVIFFPNHKDDRLKIIKELSPMIINSFGSELLSQSPYETAEFIAYPRLINADDIQEEEVDIDFTKIFNLSHDLWNRKVTDNEKVIDASRPMLFYIYSKLVVPGEFNVFTNKVEKLFQNPCDFRKQAIDIEKKIKAYLSLHNSEINVFVGNPNTTSHVLGNINAFTFIAEILMRYYMYDYDHVASQLVVEISALPDKLYVLFYYNNKCKFVYYADERNLNNIENIELFYDADYFKVILEELGVKRVFVSERDFGSDFDEIIGRDILS